MNLRSTGSSAKSVGLNAALRRTITKVSGRMSFVRHPLVVDLYHPSMHALLNEKYRLKLETLRRARRQYDWDSYFGLHERPFRLEAFLKVRNALSSKEYWSWLREVWCDSEGPVVNQDVWLGLFSAAVPNRQRYLMTSDDRALLGDLADPVTLFRGGSVEGLSWTVSRDRAEWFARRFLRPGQTPVLRTARSCKRKIIAAFTQRDEGEIVIDPATLEVSEVSF